MELSLILAAGLVVLLSLVSSRLRGQHRKRGTRAKTEKYLAVPLLNKSELSLLQLLEAQVPMLFGPNVRVFAQVSYGEFLKGTPRSAHARINQKRADFVLVDQSGNVQCVIEYQGAGHFGRGKDQKAKVLKSDEVKRHALRSAGVPFVEVPAKFCAKRVFELLRSIPAGDRIVS
jgi:hypothetical protein